MIEGLLKTTQEVNGYGSQETTVSIKILTRESGRQSLLNLLRHDKGRDGSRDWGLLLRRSDHQVHVLGGALEDLNGKIR